MSGTALPAKCPILAHIPKAKKTDAMHVNVMLSQQRDDLHDVIDLLWTHPDLRSTVLKYLRMQIDNKSESAERASGLGKRFKVDSKDGKLAIGKLP